MTQHVTWSTSLRIRVVLKKFNTYLRRNRYIKQYSTLERSITDVQLLSFEPPWSTTASAWHCT